MQKIDITRREDLSRFIQHLIKKIPSGAIVLLEGNLGAGKTEFVKEFLNQLGFSDVTSPTFSLHQNYQVRGRAFHHFDLYRVKKFSELENIGIDEILSSTFEVAFVEWPQSFFDEDLRVFARLVFEVDLNDKRSVSYSQVGQFH